MPSAPASISFSPDGSRLAVFRENGQLEIWSRVERWFLEMVNVARQ
jgi:hypothetical protein